MVGMKVYRVQVGNLLGETSVSYVLAPTDVGLEFIKTEINKTLTRSASVRSLIAVGDSEKQTLNAVGFEL